MQPERDIYSYTNQLRNQISSTNVVKGKTINVEISGKLSLKESIRYLSSLGFTQTDIEDGFKNEDCTFYGLTDLLSELQNHEVWTTLYRNEDISFFASGRARTRMRILAENGIRQNAIPLNLPSAEFYRRIREITVERRGVRESKGIIENNGGVEGYNNTSQKDNLSVRTDVPKITLVPSKEDVRIPELEEPTYKGESDAQILQTESSYNVERKRSETIQIEDNIEWNEADRILYQHIVNRDAIVSKEYAYDIKFNSYGSIFRDIFRQAHIGTGNEIDDDWEGWITTCQVSITTGLPTQRSNEEMHTILTMCYAYAINVIYFTVFSKAVDKVPNYYVFRTTSSHRYLLITNVHNSISIKQLSPNDAKAILPSYGLIPIIGNNIMEKRLPKIMIYHRELGNRFIVQSIINGVAPELIPEQFKGMLLNPIFGDGSLFQINDSYINQDKEKLNKNLDLSRTIGHVPLTKNVSGMYAIFESKRNAIPNIRAAKLFYEKKQVYEKDSGLSAFFSHIGMKVSRTSYSDNELWLGVFGVNNMKDDGISLVISAEFRISAISDGAVELYPYRLMVTSSMTRNCPDYGLPRVFFQIDHKRKLLVRDPTHTILDLGCYTQSAIDKIENVYFACEKSYVWNVAERLREIILNGMVGLNLDINQIKGVAYCDNECGSGNVHLNDSGKYLMIPRKLCSTIEFTVLNPIVGDDRIEDLQFSHDEIITSSSLSFAARYGLTPCVPAELRMTKYSPDGPVNGDLRDDSSMSTILCSIDQNYPYVVDNYLTLPCGESHEPDQCGLSLHRCVEPFYWWEPTVQEREYKSCITLDCYCECGRMKTFSKHLAYGDCTHSRLRESSEHILDQKPYTDARTAIT